MLPTDPQIAEALTAWHESGRASFEQAYRNLNYDECWQKTAKDGRHWIKLDSGSSGYYLVDKTTGDMWTIKAYGVPNRRIGTLAEVVARWRAGTTQWNSKAR